LLLFVHKKKPSLFTQEAGMTRFATSILLLVWLFGCASEPGDPFKPMNQAFYAFNDRLDNLVISPAAKTYNHLTPLWFRTSIHNFTSNVEAPKDVLYFMASGKPRDAGTMLVRFLINSTIGIGGLFDPAARVGYQSVYTDLGLVLAGYGVGEGPYLFIPIWGPTGIRDGSAAIAGLFASPYLLLPKSAPFSGVNFGISIVNNANQRANAESAIETIKHTALDPYAVFRSVFLQRRQAQLIAIDRADTRTVPGWFPTPSQGK
jgi:phospholipid-binding lipoprotein MlaA